jgi:hypothetical protein
VSNKSAFALGAVSSLLVISGGIAAGVLSYLRKTI